MILDYIIAVTSISSVDVYICTLRSKEAFVIIVIISPRGPLISCQTYCSSPPMKHVQVNQKLNIPCNISRNFLSTPRHSYNSWTTLKTKGKPITSDGFQQPGKSPSSYVNHKPNTIFIKYSTLTLTFLALCWCAACCRFCPIVDLVPL